MHSRIETSLGINPREETNNIFDFGEKKCAIFTSYFWTCYVIAFFQSEFYSSFLFRFEHIHFELSTTFVETYSIVQQWFQLSLKTWKNVIKRVINLFHFFIDEIQLSISSFTEIRGDQFGDKFCVAFLFQIFWHFLQRVSLIV